VFLVERSATADLPLSEIEKSYVGTTSGPEESGTVFILAVRPTQRGLEVVNVVTRFLRPVFVFFEGEPIGLGGMRPIASMYSLGEFGTQESAERAARRLGLTVEPLHGPQDQVEKSEAHQ